MSDERVEAIRRGLNVMTYTANEPLQATALEALESLEKENERLRGENDTLRMTQGGMEFTAYTSRLEAALREIAEGNYNDTPQRTARQALEHQDGDA